MNIMKHVPLQISERVLATMPPATLSGAVHMIRNADEVFRGVHIMQSLTKYGLPWD
jgi:hypothetical protein